MLILRESRYHSIALHSFDWPQPATNFEFFAILAQWLAVWIFHFDFLFFVFVRIERAFGNCTNWWDVSMRLTKVDNNKNQKLLWNLDHSLRDESTCELHPQYIAMHSMLAIHPLKCGIVSWISISRAFQRHMLCVYEVIDTAVTRRVRCIFSRHLWGTFPSLPPTSKVF